MKFELCAFEGAAAREAQAIRMAVFVAEQGIAAELEMDGADAGARHVLARIDGVAVGTGRLLEDGHIGRVAVLAGWRGRGVGRGIMERLVGEARRIGLERVWLSSQVGAAEFYETLGFERRGAVYVEAGIDHVDMELDLLH